jgi:hypothetical protein
MLSLITRMLREEDGMEVLEWSIVAVLFCLAGAGALFVLTGEGLSSRMREVIEVFDLAGS